MILFIAGVCIGGMSGVFAMCLVAINRDKHHDKE